jgi:hypothetical protein
MAALMGAGTFGVHQLRFAMSDDHARAVYGHGYLAAVAPVLAALLLFAFAAALRRIARGVTDPAPRLRRIWAGTSAGLIAAYCAQESIEGLLTHGHATGMFEHGGWVALPLALVVGLGIALIARGAAAASALVADRTGRAAACAARPHPPLVETLVAPWTPRRTDAAARHLAARGPPLSVAAL